MLRHLALPARDHPRQQALADVIGASCGWQDDGPSHPVVEIAIYPDVLWLAARIVQVQDTRPCAAP
jgi:hypothetical protein